MHVLQSDGRYHVNWPSGNCLSSLWMTLHKYMQVTILKFTWLITHIKITVLLSHSSRKFYLPYGLSHCAYSILKFNHLETALRLIVSFGLAISIIATGNDSLSWICRFQLNRVHYDIGTRRAAAAIEVDCHFGLRCSEWLTEHKERHLYEPQCPLT